MCKPANVAVKSNKPKRKRKERERLRKRRMYIDSLNKKKTNKN